MAAVKAADRNNTVRAFLSTRDAVLDDFWSHSCTSQASRSGDGARTAGRLDVRRKDRFPTVSERV